MKEKKITIEKLAEMVQKGFTNIENRMATKVDMEEGFKNVNEKLDSAIEKHNEETRGLREKVKVLQDALATEE